MAQDSDNDQKESHNIMRLWFDVKHDCYSIIGVSLFLIAVAFEDWALNLPC